MLALSHNNHWTVVYTERKFSVINKYSGYTKNLESSDSYHYFVYSQMCRDLSASIRVHFNPEIPGLESAEQQFYSSNDSYWKMVAVTSHHLPTGKWWLFQVEDLDICIKTIVYADVTNCSCCLLTKEQRITGVTKIFC